MRALKARNKVAASVLRSALGAIDNASAIPVGRTPATSASRATLGAEP